MKLSKLKINPDNPRLIKDDRFELLVKSLKDFPKMMVLRPIIVDKDNMILGGNMRFKALKELNYKEIPDEWVKCATDLTDAEKREFIIKDNVGFGEHDFELLADWDEPLEEWGVMMEFIEDEQEAEEDNYVIPDEIKTDIKIGDIFQIGEHRLMCGDSTDSDSVAKLMNGEKADMVFTDPPYGMNLDTDYSKMPKAPNGATPLKHEVIKGDNDDFTPDLINTIFASFPDVKEIFIWGADYFAELILDKNFGSWVVWDKRVDENFDKMIGAAFELCWSKNKHQRKIARFNNTLFSGEKDAQNKVHPTQKPIKLAEWFFNNWGKENDLIADIYLGSGTTMVAAHQLKRKCYGMELDPKYCQVIIDRMKLLDPDIKITQTNTNQL